ncbi:SRPBCC family protein [Ilumatobacter nonamiensis]|uniref:SRPBCC family protein n=1 Tax=Ilumatobacter nonamiensis TaxID=467093 RepID=UPI00034A55C9|nr:SRPBCC family protein [Ilumatobacter nonamiensis]
MADIRFEVRHRFAAPPRRVWDELVDWQAHERWIPLTKMQVDPGDPTEVGHELTARTGVGRVALPDRMRVTACEWDDGAAAGECVVEKLGPVLRGRAGFTVGADPEGCVVDWFEDVTVPYVPGFVAPLGGWIGAFFFRQGMRRLERVIRR